jgi:hypothetical protein
MVRIAAALGCARKVSRWPVKLVSATRVIAG